MDKDLLARFEEIDKLNEHQKAIAKEILDGLIIKSRVGEMAVIAKGGLDKKPAKSPRAVRRPKKKGVK